jgi:hypothetical protein
MVPLLFALQIRPMEADQQAFVAPVDQWIQITNHPDYDIQTTFPHLIRKRSNQRIIALTPRNDGYLQCRLDGRLYLQHRIIMEQFVPNPDNLPCCDHISHVRDENRITNLRWISHTNNQRNKSSSNRVEYVYVAELPDEAIVVETHAGHTYHDYYYCDRQFYYYTGEAYRRLHINTNARSGCRHVKLIDDNGVKRDVSLAAYQRHIGEIV